MNRYARHHAARRIGGIVDRDSGVEHIFDLNSQPFADNGNVNASNFPNVGGNYNNGDNAGPFNANFNNSATNTNSNIGARLSCIISRSILHRKGMGKSMQPQLLLKKDGRTLIADIVPHMALVLPKGRRKKT